VADFIDDMRQSNQWPLNLSEVAEQTGYSRSHVSNTLEDYYEQADEPQSESETVDRDGITITIPDDVDRMSYLRGWIAREKLNSK